MPSELYFPSSILYSKTTMHKSNAATYSAGITVWTPASGKRIILTGVRLEHITGAGTPVMTVMNVAGTIIAFRGVGQQYQVLSMEWTLGLDIFNVNDPIFLTNSSAALTYYSLYGYEV